MPTRVSRRRWLQGSAALAAAASPLARAAQGRTALTVSYTATPEFGAVFIAKERGLFEQQGLDVTLQLIPVAPNAPPALMSNSVQIAGTTPSVLLQAIDSGLDLVGVAGGGTFDTRQAAPIGLVARTGVNVVQPSDLVGKRVAVPGLGAAIHLLARKWLMDGGVDTRKVTFVEIPIPQMADVLKGGSVDVVAVPEPFVSRMVQAQIGTAVPAFSKVITDGVSTVLFASTRAWATSHGREVQAFRTATQQAVAWAVANRDAAMDEIGKYFKVPPALLKATPFPHFAPELREEQLRFWVDTMRTQEMLRRQTVLASSILR
jgi:NitT/TauT family transport system substrate-binding protein